MASREGGGPRYDGAQANAAEPAVIAITGMGRSTRHGSMRQPILDSAADDSRPDSKAVLGGTVLGRVQASMRADA
jgi:hypothetical protein